MLWVGVHLPLLSLECFVATLAPEPAADTPDDVPPPVALVLRHRVVAVDAAAQARGLRPGQQRATALALAPDTRIGEADALRDTAALQAIAHAMMAFTPAVSIAPGHVVLAEVQASLRYFGGLAPLLERLRAALAPLGHALRLACAPTPQGAQWLATWRDDADAGPLPRTRSAWREGLGRLPVALIAAAEPHRDALRTLGLRTLADVLKQPRAGLARRFGPELLAEVDRAFGDLGDPRVPLAPAERFDSRLELFMRADDSAALMTGAVVLLQRLSAWAAAHHGRIAGFRLRLHHETHRRTREDPSARTTLLDVALAEPSADPTHLQALLRERLQRLPLAASVIELSLFCDALVPGAPPNTELFPTAASEGEGWLRLLERLEARLGAHNLQRLAPIADHRPELATARVPHGTALATTLGGTRGLPLRLAQADPEDEPLPDDPGDWPRQRRPVWLLPEPQALREAFGTPLLAGRPLRLVAGPERIEAGWWDRAPAARDYFIAQAGDGALLWVYRERQAPAEGESGWILQGRFG